MPIVHRPLRSSRVAIRSIGAGRPQLLGLEAAVVAGLLIELDLSEPLVLLDELEPSADAVLPDVFSDFFALSPLVSDDFSDDDLPLVDARLSLR